MNPRHPEDATFVAWVSGALDERDAAAFEAHVMVDGCQPCAMRLERCARLEEAMYEAAAQPPIAKRRRATTRASMPSGLALAASLVLGLGLPGRWLSFEGPGELPPSASGPLLASRAVDATPWRETAATCAAPDDASDDGCGEPNVSIELEGALAMTMPEPSADDGPNLCEDNLESDRLACGVGELLDG